MAQVDEVINWESVNTDNPAPIPPGPDGKRPRRIGLAMQEIMGSIARWRDTLAGQTGELTLSANEPFVRWIEEDATSQNRVWDILPVGEQLRFRVGNDDLNSFNEFMTVDRTDNVIDDISLSAAQIQLGNFIFDADSAAGATEDNYVLKFDWNGGTNPQIRLEPDEGGLFQEDSDANIFGGTNAGSSLVASSGTNNFLGGNNAGPSLSTGDDNVGIGNEALFRLEAGQRNVAIGDEAGYNITASDNTAIGYNAMGGNIGVGTGSFNVAVGSQAMSSASQTSAANNTVIGYSAGDRLTTGANNIFIGHQAGFTSNVSNRLAIDITERNDPLIDGDFSLRTVEFNGGVNITGNLTANQDLIFAEQADHSSTPAAGFGYLWVKNDTPSSLIFTDDAGTDYDLTNISSSIEVEDEGVSLTTAVTKFNFVGAGVVATEPVANEITVTIAGGSGVSELSDLSDVNTSTPTDRNVLVADGVDWESRALVEADISDLGSYVDLSTNQTAAGEKTFSDVMLLGSPAKFGAEQLAIEAEQVGGTGALWYQEGIRITARPITTDWSTQPTWQPGLFGVVADASGSGNWSAETQDINVVVAFDGDYGAVFGATGTINNAYGARLQLGRLPSGVTIDNAYGLFLGEVSSSATVTNYWGVYQNVANARNYFAGDLVLAEKADHGSLETAAGHLWARNDTPNRAIFTDDAGTDNVLAYVSEIGIGGTIATAQVAYGTAADTIGGSNDFAYTAGQLFLTKTNADTTTPLLTLQQSGAGDAFMKINAGATDYAIGVDNSTANNDLIFAQAADLNSNVAFAISASGTVNYTGKLTTAGSLAGSAGFNLPAGVAPTTPTDGDVWLTTSGVFARVNGVTNQLDAAGGIGGSIAVDQIAVGSAADTIEGTASFTWNDTTDKFTADTFEVYGSGTAGAGSARVDVNGSFKLGFFGTQTIIYDGSGGLGIEINGDNVNLAAAAGSGTVTSNKNFNITGTNQLRFDSGAFQMRHDTNAILQTTGGHFQFQPGGTTAFEIFDGANDGVRIGQTGSVLVPIYANNATGRIQIAGGNSSTNGGNIYLWGGSNATRAGDVSLASGGNEFFLWDETVGSMQINTGIGTKFLQATINDQGLELVNDLEFAEQADHANTPTAGSGYLWVRNDTPNVLVFTDDAGTDTVLGSGGGIGGSIADNQVAVGNGTDAIDGSANLTWDDTTFGIVGRLNPSPGSGNIVIGSNAGNALPASGGGASNVLVGGSAGAELNFVTSNFNVMMGVSAGSEGTNRNSNVLIGFQAGQGSTTTLPLASTNVFIGRSIATLITSAGSNVGVGANAFRTLTSGAFNVGIGEGSGDKITTGLSNVMLGQDAGPTSNQSNRLYIDNTETDNPLIGGDFVAREVEIDGDLTADNVPSPFLLMGA